MGEDTNCSQKLNRTTLQMESEPAYNRAREDCGIAMRANLKHTALFAFVHVRLSYIPDPAFYHNHAQPMMDKSCAREKCTALCFPERRQRR